MRGGVSRCVPYALSYAHHHALTYDAHYVFPYAPLCDFTMLDRASMNQIVNTKIKARLYEKSFFDY